MAMRLLLTRDTVEQARIDVCRNVKIGKYADVDTLLLCEKMQDAETIFSLRSAPEVVLIPVAGYQADLLLSLTRAISDADFV